MGIAKYAGGVRQRTIIRDICFFYLPAYWGLKDREFSYRARIVAVAEGTTLPGLIPYVVRAVVESEKIYSSNV